MTCGRRWERSHTGCPGGSSHPDTPGAEPSPPPTSLAFPGYQLEHTVAQGGFGTLLAARRLSDGQRVAIKVAHAVAPLKDAGLLREAKALRAIGPPTVPEVYEAGRLKGGISYLAMQFISHPLLAHRLGQQSGPLPTAEAGRYGLALAEAITAVHAQRFIHCDLKPENVFLNETTHTVGFFDFGLTCALPPRAPEAGSASVLSGAGTAEYMAPEQCSGGALDERTDVYAAGVLLYELLTGRPPFFGPVADVLQSHVSRRPPRPSELAPVPAALEEVVLRCLAKEPYRRYESARALALALREALAHCAPAPAPAQSPPSPAPTIHRRTVAILFLRSGVNPLTVQRAISRCSGQLAYHEGTCFAAVFDPDVEENPVQRARQCAECLCAEGLAVTAVVDVGTVRVQSRPRGPPRYMSAVFARRECYPNEDDPPTLLLTSAALEAMPELVCVPVPQHVGLFRRAPPVVEQEDTSVLWLGRGLMVGRQSELEELERSAHTTVQQAAPTLAMALGERGQGKSHLAAALVQRLQEQLPQARVLSLRAREPVQGDPESTLRMLLRAALGAHNPEQSGGEAAHQLRCEELLGSEGAREHWPAVASSLGWHSPGTGLQSAAAAPGALRSLSMRAAGELLIANARTGPLLLLLDDAHFAEDTALDALEYATRAGTQLPLWVCVLGRPTLPRTRTTLGTRAALNPIVELKDLSLPSAMELCRTLLRPAEGVPAEALERLAKRAQRVPLFIVELVRGLKRQGLVRQRPQGSWYLATDELDHVPEMRLVEWLADHELSALPTELTAHARLCALLGSDFTVEDVEGVVKELDEDGGAADFPLDPRHATRRLVELGLLMAHQTSGLRYRNELIREMVARSLPEAQIRRLHHAAYRFYLREATTKSQRLPRLAFHAAAAGLHEEAAPLYIDLAESARSRHAYLESEATYSRALELLPEDDLVRRLTVLRGRGLMRYRVGRCEDSLADFIRARELALKMGNMLEEVDLLLDEAMALDWANDYVRSEQRVHQAEALALATRLYTPLLQVRLMLGLGRVLFRQCQWGHARVLLEAAANQSCRLGDAGYESRIVAMLLLGVILPNLGRIDEAQRVMEECIATCAERGDRLHQGSAINNRRNLWVARNDLPRALADQERFMQVGRDLGMLSWEFIGEYNLGELYYQAGDSQAAAPHIARALKLEYNHPEVAPRPWGLLLSARALVYEGQEEKARHALEAIHQVIEERPGAELSPSESVLLSLVDLATRDASAEEWEALQKRSDACSVEQEPLEVLELQALARLRRGEREVAVRLLEEALRRAEKIPNIMRERLLRSLKKARGE